MILPSEFTDAGLYAPQQQGARDQLGQEDFLTLMITQFRNQDPFQPMENGEFLGQLAQFSTVSGIDSLNGAFAGLSGAMLDEQALQAANLVGRNVLAISDNAHFGGNEAVRGAIELGSPASNVQVEITNANGEVIRRLDLGEQPSGMARFEWDGRDDNGDLVADGNYRVAARAIFGISYESVPTLIESNVESVTLGRFGGGMTLNLPGGGSLSLAQVYQIT